MYVCCLEFGYSLVLGCWCLELFLVWTKLRGLIPHEMKATGIINLACVLMVAGLTAGLVLERQACLKLKAQNDELRTQLGRMTELTAESQRLTDLLARANALHLRPDGTMDTNALPDARVAELTQLHREVEAFQQQSNDVVNLRADTSATRVALKAAHDAENARQLASHTPPDLSSRPLEILEADYGTTRSNVEVSAALNDRVRNGSLKVLANNNMNGDPDFGQVKNLTVIYRYGRTTMTNQFREGDAVVLPPDPSGTTP